MSTPASRHDAEVLSRTRISEHLVRLVLGGPGLADLVSTGIPDEWVGLVVPDQFQSRYYTVRSWSQGRLVLDVVVHEEGLVTSWASAEESDLVGQTCVVTAPQGSFAPPAHARWLLLVGDLTALPAMARVLETTSLPSRVWAEVPDDPTADGLADYLPARPDVEVTWSAPPAPGASALADVVEAIDWPEGEGYFWMAGESLQMRTIRKHLMRERRLPAAAYDVMGYWRGGAVRRLRAADARVSRG